MYIKSKIPIPHVSDYVQVMSFMTVQTDERNVASPPMEGYYSSIKQMRTIQYKSKNERANTTKVKSSRTQKKSNTNEWYSLILNTEYIGVRIGFRPCTLIDATIAKCIQHHDTVQLAKKFDRDGVYTAVPYLEVPLFKSTNHSD